MTRSSNGSANVVAGRLVSLLAGAIGGTFLLFTGCTPPPDEGVLAFVNGRQITQTEFDIRWGELAEATRARYQKEGGKRLFLDELITRELLMQEARKLGLDQNDTIRDRTQIRGRSIARCTTVRIPQGRKRLRFGRPGVIM